DEGGCAVTLPRVVAGVSARDVGGWVVETRHWAAGRLVVPPYRLDAVEVAAGGVDHRVPAVPADRQPAEDATHYRLGAGDPDAVVGLLERLATGRTEPDDVRVYGRWLFECLLAPAWPAIRADCAVAQARGVELALEWPVGDTDLHRLVWEAMH